MLKERIAMRLHQEIVEKYLNKARGSNKYLQSLNKNGNFYEVKENLIIKEISNIKNRDEESYYDEYRAKEIEKKVEKYIKTSGSELLLFIKKIASESIGIYTREKEMILGEVDVLKEQKIKKKDEIEDLELEINKINENNKSLVSKTIGVFKKGKISYKIAEIEKDIEKLNLLKKESENKISGKEKEIDLISYNELVLFSDDLDTFRKKFYDKKNLDVFISMLSDSYTIKYQNIFGYDIQNKIKFLEKNIVKEIVNDVVSDKFTPVQNRANIAKRVKGISRSAKLNIEYFLDYIIKDGDNKVLPLSIDEMENPDNKNNMLIKIRINKDFIIITELYDTNGREEDVTIKPVAYFFEDNKFEDIKVMYYSKYDGDKEIKYIAPVVKDDDSINIKNLKASSSYKTSLYESEYDSMDSYDEYRYDRIYSHSNRSGKDKKVESERNLIVIDILKSHWGNLQVTLNAINNTLRNIIDGEYDEVAVETRSRHYSLKNASREYALLNMFIRETSIRARMIEKPEVKRERKKL